MQKELEDAAREQPVIIEKSDVSVDDSFFFLWSFEWFAINQLAYLNISFYFRFKYVPICVSASLPSKAIYKFVSVIVQDLIPNILAFAF